MKRIISLGIAVIVVVLLWTGAWFYLANEIRKNILLLADADGVTVSRLTCDRLAIGGYPFHFNVDCTGMKLFDGDVVFAFGALRVSVQVYQPTFLIASALGPATLEDSFTGSRSAIDFSQLQGSLRLDGWRIARLSLVGKDFVWNDTLAGQNLIGSSPGIEVHLLDIPEQHDAKTGKAALALYVKAEAARFPGLAITDGAVELQAELSGLPDDIRAYGDPSLLQSIQQAGGKLKLVSIAASDTEASTLNANGELGLDGQGLLEGNLDVSSKGVADRVSPLIDPPFRALVLGNPDAEGMSHQKFIARGGNLYSGIIPIGAVPSLYGAPTPE